MSRANFRVKVDLSSYYQDVRRFCWVFIDGTKVLQVCDVKEHITKLFNIQEPFHLLLNSSEYLPPFEDVRILKENETIVVVPGSGMQNEVESSSCNKTLANSHDDVQMQERPSQIYVHKETQTIQTPFTKARASISDIPNTSRESLSNSKQDISSIDMTFYSVLNETEESATESKVMESMDLTEDYSMTENEPTSIRRKRLRRRKGKKHVPLSIKSVDDEDTSKKPKIIDSFVISSGKHIRFDMTENGDAQITKQIANDVSMDASSTNKPSSCQDLSTLLALRHSSTPLTFTSKKIKEEVIKSEAVDIDTSEQTSSEKINDTLNASIEKLSQKVNSQSFSDIDLQAHSPVTSDAQVNDVIAFKMLRIGADYTPQVSDLIIAQVLSYCQRTNCYVLKVIQGKEQVQVPFGKFRLPEGEDENERNVIDTVRVNYAQMIEPRFLKRATTEKLATSNIIS